MTLRHKKLVLVLLLLTLLVATVFAVLNLQRQQELRSRAAANPITVTLSPQSGATLLNQSFPVKVLVNTNGQSLTGVDMTITFDKDVLDLSEFTPTNAFSTRVINEVSQEGTLRYVAVTVTNIPQSGEAVELGTLSFRPNKAAEAKVAITNFQATVLGSDTFVPVNSLPTGTYTVDTQASQIGGRVFIDTNKNGKFDSPAESPVPASFGYRILVKKGDSSFPVSLNDNGNGQYVARDLSRGTYTVTYTNLPAGFEAIVPTGSQPSYTITVGSTCTVTPENTNATCAGSNVVSNADFGIVSNLTPTPSPTRAPTPSITVSCTLPTSTKTGVTYTAKMLGENEIPTIDSQAAGQARMILAGQVIYVSYCLSGNLTGLPAGTGIHFAAPNEEAPQSINLPAIESGASKEFSMSLSEAWVDQIRNGNAYINVTSTGFRDGELRGQFGRQ